MITGRCPQKYEEGHRAIISAEEKPADFLLRYPIVLILFHYLWIAENRLDYLEGLKTT